MQRSKLAVGLVVALGVGALGLTAVAMEKDTGGSGSVGGAVATTIAVDPSTTTSTTEAPTTTLAPITDPATTPADSSDGDVARSTDGCDGGTYANHGDYVSSIAHDPGRQPGDVPAAAQSDCGKPIPSADAGDSGGTSTPETEAPDAGAGTDSPSLGAGHGKSGK
jgi:hypothetical protein